MPINNETLTIDPGASPFELNAGDFVLRSFESPTPARKRIEATTVDTEGSIPVSSQYENRTVTAVVRAESFGTRASWYTKLQKLQMKIGKINNEGGVMRRILVGGTSTMYYDLVDASADIDWDNVRYALRMDQDLTLTFLALPLIRGDELTLSSHAETTLPALIFTETGIKGDVAATGRLVITETQASADQNWMVWGLQSRYYDGSVTAKLFYEAEALTVLDAALVTALTGGSGGSSIRHGSLPGVQWCPVMSTDIAATGKMTHKGSYRVVARVYSNARPLVRLMWGLGDFTHTVTNGTVQLPVSAAICLVDLGVIRLGTSAQWSGVIQANASVQGDTLSVDCLFFIPVDENTGEAVSVQQSSILGINVTNNATVAANDMAQGWLNLPWNFAQAPGSYSVVMDNENLPSSASSPILKLTGFGFNIPTGATIAGILIPDVYEYCAFSSVSVFDNRVSLFKAGLIQTTNYGTNVALSYNSYWAQHPFRQYGGQADLWGTTWTPAQINDPGFGVGFGFNISPQTRNDVYLIGPVKVTIFYTTSGGLTVPNDTVMYQTRTMEISDKGAKRQNSTGAFTVPLADYRGDALRVPPAGVEARTCRFIVKASRNNPDVGSDPNIDDISAQLFYTPRWLQNPDT